jgi:hypothetical protein
MRFRPLLLPVGALALLAMASASPADANGQSRQAELRISLTVVDSCDIALPARQAGPSDAADVDCSAFMPHQLAVTPWTPPDGRAVDAMPDTTLQAFPHERDASRLAADAAAFPTEPRADRIRIATITF